LRNKSLLKEHSSLISDVQKILDLACILGAGLAAHRLLIPSANISTSYQFTLICGLLIGGILLRKFNLYKSWRGINFITEVSSLLLAWTATIVVLSLIVYSTGGSGVHTREWLLCWWLLGGALTVIIHYCVRIILKELRAKGYNQRTVVIFGSDELGDTAQTRLEASSETGLKVEACFTLKSDRPNDSELERGLSYVEAFRPDQIWIALPFTKSDQIQKILTIVPQSSCDIRIVPDMFALGMMNQSLSVVAGLPVINVSITPMDGLNRFLKAIQDRLLSCLILLLISPLLVALMVGVKISSPGPVFFRQQRLSWNGRPFMMYKLRSMPVNSEASTGPVWAKAGEQRATRFGQFLRRTSLDELPQFFNVLKGDMSIVGPRPERPEFVQKFRSEIPGYMQKHMVKAGITGWAQVNGWRGDTCLHTRISHDLDYIRRWSLWLDLKIICMTVFKGFINRNAY